MLACGKSGERGDNYLLADEGDAGDVGDCHCLLAVDGGDVELVGAGESWVLALAPGKCSWHEVGINYRRLSRLAGITSHHSTNTHATYFHHFLYRFGRFQEKQALF
jgi:hypothetical protein